MTGCLKVCSAVLLRCIVPMGEGGIRELSVLAAGQNIPASMIRHDLGVKNYSGLNAAGWTGTYND